MKDILKNVILNGLKKNDLLDIYNEKSSYDIILRKDYKKSLNYIFNELENIINN